MSFDDCYLLKIALCIYFNNGNTFELKGLLSTGDDLLDIALCIYDCYLLKIALCTIWLLSTEDSSLYYMIAGLNFDKHKITHSEKSGMSDRPLCKKSGQLTVLKSEISLSSSENEWGFTWRVKR